MQNVLFSITLFFQLYAHHTLPLKQNEEMKHDRMNKYFRVKTAYYGFKSATKIILQGKFLMVKFSGWEQEMKALFTGCSIQGRFFTTWR